VSEGIASHILNIGPRLRWMVSFTPPAAILPVK